MTTGAPGSPSTSKDFRRLRESGEQAGASRAIGGRIVAWRDGLARGMIAVGFTPNRVTILGFLITCGAGWCLVKGASHQASYFYDGVGSSSMWPAWAALFLFLAGACDMLDGAIARIGNMSSKFGAILDSTIDRLSDLAIFLGCLIHFTLADRPNLTLVTLSVLALSSSFLISYVKARAEDIIDDCSVGFWLRGERFAAVLIGCATGHVVAVLWQLGLTNWLTVWRRIDYSRRAVLSMERGTPPPASGPEAGVLGRAQLWRRPRGSVGYDLIVSANILWIVVAPWIWPTLGGNGAWADPLRTWLKL